MNGDVDKREDDDSEETAAPDQDTAADSLKESSHEDTVVDADVERLVARIDKTDADEAARKREIRRQLDEAKERREKDLDSTFNFNLDEDL